MKPVSRKIKEEIILIDEEENQEISSSQPLESKSEVVQYKDYTDVFTPPKIAMDMAKMLKLDKECSVLDPCAGHGILIKAVNKLLPTLHVHYIEINSVYSWECFKTCNEYTVCLGDEDFLKIENLPKYDRIICNPPFDEDKWVYFIRKSYYLLNPKGILVCIYPKFNPNDKIIYKEMMDKLKDAELNVTKIDNWHTNKDGTTTPISIIKIKKP